MNEQQRQDKPPRYIKSERQTPVGLKLRHGQEQTFTCSAHGAYTGKPFSLTGKTWIDPACPECEAGRKEREIEEAERAKAEAWARKLELAGIPPRFYGASLDNFEAKEPLQRRALAYARRYLDRWPERRESGGSLMFLGTTGTGKTHLACAMVAALAGAGNRAYYTDLMDMMGRIKATYRRTTAQNESEEQVIEHYASFDFLVIDEIGMQYGSDTELAVVHRILDKRYLRVRPSLVAGNIDLDGLREYLGERAVSRMHESGGAVVSFDWDDYRMRDQ